MALDLAKRPFPITCANCGNSVQQTLAWIKDHLEFPCPRCGATIRADRANINQTIADLEKADTAINDSLRRVRDAFKG